MLQVLSILLKNRFKTYVQKNLICIDLNESVSKVVQSSDF